MKKQPVLVTGSRGFFGAWIVKELLRRGEEVVATDLTQDSHIWDQVLTKAEEVSVASVRLDISDAAKVQATIAKYKPKAIIHLAGLQIPMCKSNPALGATVNVVGTVNLFTAAAEEKPPPVIVYASSAAVFGPESDYGGNPVPADFNHKPRFLYGVYKLCNEGTARIFWEENQVASAAVRPLTVFGVGREIGLTSAPSKAVKAAVLKRAYEVPMKGETAFQYVEDVANIFVNLASALRSRGGCHVCNVKGVVDSVENFVAAINSADVVLAKDAAQVPIASNIDDSTLREALNFEGEIYTPIAKAIDRMKKHYEILKKEKKLHDKDLPPLAKSRL